MHRTLPEEEFHRLRDRIRGCLLGVAIGDALGAPFEHVPCGTSLPVLEKTGGLIRDFHSTMSHPKGGWTDDTAMTMAACRGFLRSREASLPLEAALRDALRRAELDPGYRKPGKTIRQAVRTGFPDVDSLANGALMRIAPSTIYAVLSKASIEETANVALYLARLTHGHPLAVFPAVECSLALASIFRDEERVPEEIKEIGKIRFFSKAHLRYAEYEEKRQGSLSEIPPSSGLWMWRFVLERILGLGPGDPWERLPSFEEGMIKAVNESYDRDTAGAVAGAILGAYWGESAIPERWRNHVERGEEIVSIGDAMIRTIERDSDELARIIIANTLEIETRYLKVDPGRAHGQMAIHAENLMKELQKEVVENTLGFAIVLAMPTGENTWKLIIMKSQELISSFYWPAHNPGLPWQMWAATSGVIEEWKNFCPTGIDPREGFQMRFCGSIDQGLEVIYWGRTEPSLPMFRVIDGRYVPPQRNQLCILEAGPEKKAVFSSARYRIEEDPTAYAREVIEGGGNLSDMDDLRLLLDRLYRTQADPMLCAKFCTLALKYDHPDIRKTVYEILRDKPVWDRFVQEQSKKSRRAILQEIERLSESPYRFSSALAARMMVLLGTDLPHAVIRGFLSSDDPITVREAVLALDGLNEKEGVNVFASFSSDPEDTRILHGAGAPQG